MDLRPLGATGVDIAPLVFGAMNFGIATPPAEAAVMLDHAIDAGVTLVDTADVYGESEQVVGDDARGERRRDEVLLATKVGLPRGEGTPDQWHRREHIMASCDRSLRHLQTDHIDLYQLHRPSSVVPLAETLGVLGELVDAGKVRWIGSSTFAAWMVVEELAMARERDLPAFVSEQPPYNLLDRRIENELLPMCERYELAVLPWSPIGGGVLSGRYDAVDRFPEGSRAALVPQTRDRVTEPGLRVAAAVADLARERGLSTAQLALLWVKDQPGVTAPIVGPRTLAQTRRRPRRLRPLPRRRGPRRLRRAGAPGQRGGRLPQLGGLDAGHGPGRPHQVEGSSLFGRWVLDSARLTKGEDCRAAFRQARRGLLDRALPAARHRPGVLRGLDLARALRAGARGDLRHDLAQRRSGGAAPDEGELLHQGDRRRPHLGHRGALGSTVRCGRSTTSVATAATSSCGRTTPRRRSSGTCRQFTVQVPRLALRPRGRPHLRAAGG